MYHSELKPYLSWQMPLKWGGFSSQLPQVQPFQALWHLKSHSARIEEHSGPRASKLPKTEGVFCPPWMTSRTLKRNIQGIHVRQKHDFKTQKTLKEIKKTPYPRFCGHPLCRMLRYPTRNGSSPHLQTCLLRFVFSAFERTFLRPAKGAEMSCFPNFKKRFKKKS